MKELEKVIDRIIYGTDMDWNMNIHHFDWVPGRPVWDLENI